MLPRWSWAVPLLLFVLFVGSRVARIDADPPTRYPTGLFAQELIVEGPAKAHEARRFGLFGTFATKETDNYYIWRTQSPVYVGPLAAFFRMFGVGYTQLRIFCALAAGLGMLAFFRLGREHANPWVAPIASLIFSLSFFDIQLTRSALLEPYLNGVLSLTFLAGVLALRSLPWMILCQLAFAAALLTKQTALFAFPVLFALGIAAHLQAARRSVPTWQHVASIGTGVVAAGLLLLYVTTPRFWETVQWNFGHMIVGEEKHHTLSLGAFQVGEILARLKDWERWRDGFFFLVPLAALAAIQIARTLWAAVRRRPFEAVDLVAAGWLLCAVFALQLTDHVRPRFSVIVVPPTALLSGSFLASLFRSRVHLAIRFAPLMLAAALVLRTDVRWQWQWLSAPKYEFKRAEQVMRKTLGKDTVVVGSWAPPIVFNTDTDTFYVKEHFNTSKERLGALGVTHLLLRSRQEWTGNFVSRRFPQAFAAKEPVSSFRLLGRKYTLFRLTEPLGDTGNQR